MRYLRINLAALLLIATLCQTACAGKGDQVVVRVGEHAITKSALERWAAIEAVLSYQLEPTQPPPSGLVPDPPNYAKCVVYMATAPKPAGSPQNPTKAQLKTLCEQKQRFLEHHMLDILISDYWLDGEGAAMGLRVTDAEIAKSIRNRFSNAAVYRGFLRLTGQTDADERFLLHADLMATKLQQTLGAKEGLKSEQQQQLAFAKFTEEQLAQKWSARTTCKPGYIVQECKEYNGPKAAV